MYTSGERKLDPKGRHKMQKTMVRILTYSRWECKFYNQSGEQLGLTGIGEYANIL